MRFSKNLWFFSLNPRQNLFHNFCCTAHIWSPGNHLQRSHTKDKIYLSEVLRRDYQLDLIKSVSMNKVHKSLSYHLYILFVLVLSILFTSLCFLRSTQTVFKILLLAPLWWNGNHNLTHNLNFPCAWFSMIIIYQIT